MRSVDVEARRVYTNNPHAGAMRGYTSCQIHFCHDLHMQYAAEEMGIDPVEFRKISAVDPGYETPSGIKVTSCASKECLDNKVISKEKAELQMPFREAVFTYMAAHGGDELTGVGSYSHEGKTAQYDSTGGT